MKQALSAVAPRRADNPLRVEAGHKVVVWSPERFRIDVTRYGIAEIPQFEFVQIGDHSYMANELTETEMAAAERNRSEMEVLPLKRHVIPAFLMAEELINQFGGRGLVRLDDLTDLDLDVLQRAETVLLHDAEGAIAFPSFGAVVRHLDGLQLEGQLGQLLGGVIRQMVDGVTQARRHWETFSMDRVGEAERARTTGQGRATFTVQERQMAGMVDLELPADVLRRPTGPQAMTPEDVVQMINTQAAERDERMLTASANLLADVLKQVLPNLPGAAPAAEPGETADKSGTGKKK